MVDDEFHEQFLKANANVDFIASELADVLRRSMRAAASSNPTPQICQAAETFRFLLQLLARAEEIRSFELFDKAIGRLDVETLDDSVDEAIVHAAQMGMRYLVERSCDDSAARGRAAKREREFLEAIRWIDEERESRRRKSSLSPL